VGLVSQETVEYLLRQQSKVKTPKTLVKVVRAHTRELKRATRREHDKAVVEAVSGVSKEAIRGLSEIGKGLAEAHGRAVSAWLGNVNPITWAAGGVAMVAYVSWLTLMLKDTAVKLGLPQLAALIPTATTITKEAINDVLDDTLLGSLDRPPDLPAPTPTPGPRTIVASNTFWIVRIQSPSGDTVFQNRFYDTQAAAEQGFTASQISLALFNFAFRQVRLIQSTNTVYSDGFTERRETLLKQWPGG